MFIKIYTRFSLYHVCVRDYKYSTAILNDNHRTDGIWNTDSDIRSATVSVWKLYLRRYARTHSDESLLRNKWWWDRRLYSCEKAERSRTQCL